MHSAMCKTSVTRAFYGMLDHGATPYGALVAAAQVYRYHHPEETLKIARSVVEEWLNVHVLQ